MYLNICTVLLVIVIENFHLLRFLKLKPLELLFETIYKCSTVKKTRCTTV